MPPILDLSTRLVVLVGHSTTSTLNSASGAMIFAPNPRRRRSAESISVAQSIPAPAAAIDVAQRTSSAFRSFSVGVGVWAVSLRHALRALGNAGKLSTG